MVTSLKLDINQKLINLNEIFKKFGVQELEI